MPNRTNSRAASNARVQILDTLKEDHKRVKKAYRDFIKLDLEEDPERCEALVRQVLADLELHTALEEELLYPAARAALNEPDLIDEAEVEHASCKTLIEQLKGMDADDDKYAARFTVLCEYVLHHIKEEEGELFPQLQSARIDWQTMAREMQERRVELAPAQAAGEGEADTEEDALASPQTDKGNAPSSARRVIGKASGGPRSQGAGSDGRAGEPGNAMDSRRV